MDAILGRLRRAAAGQPQHPLRRPIEQGGERRRQPRPDHQRRDEPSRELFGVEEGGTLWGELPEDHMEIRDCGQRDRAGDRETERDLDRNWQRAERITQDPGERGLRHPPQSEACQRHAQLAGRQQGWDVSCTAEGEPGQSVAVGRAPLQPSAPRAD